MLLDDINLRLIAELQADARLSVAELGRRVALSSPAVAELFAASDPYVVNGVVSTWRVREWTTVVGELAESPLPNPFVG